MVILHILFSLNIFVLIVLVFCPYIFTKIVWKIYENEILYFKPFCYSDFPFLSVWYPELFWDRYSSLGFQTQTSKLSKVLISGVSFHHCSLLQSHKSNVLSYPECKIANISRGFAPECHWRGVTVPPRLMNCTMVFLLATLAEKPAAPKNCWMWCCLYIFSKIFRKIYENKILHLSNFWVISSYFVTQIFPSYIFMNFFWKIYENKILYLSNFWIIWSYFVTQIFPYIFIKILWKICQNKVLCLNDFWLISIYFVTQIFSSNIFVKIFWKTYENKILYSSNF